MIPGIHNESLKHYRDPLSDHHIRCNPKGKAVSIEMKADGVVIFCYGVPHQTGPNHSNKPRAGIAYHFIHQDFYSEHTQKKIPNNLYNNIQRNNLS